MSDNSEADSGNNTHYMPLKTQRVFTHAEPKLPVVLSSGHELLVRPRHKALSNTRLMSKKNSQTPLKLPRLPEDAVANARAARKPTGGHNEKTLRLPRVTLRVMCRGRKRRREARVQGDWDSLG